MDKEYLNTKGRIFDIQRYSVHDGPGIRTIVFLKGCILRCRWCCNPESQEFGIQQMKTVNGRIKTVGQDVTVAEVMTEVNKDLDYYRVSGGGVTLSGGECLCQADFAAAILRAAKEECLNTAIESTGSLPYENIEKLLPYLDLYMMDIKHMNSEKHKEFTGIGNERILENSKKIAASGVKLIIRVPTIPTFNNTPEEISAIAQYAATLPGVSELHLLPYHRLGQDKYTGLGRPYALDGIPPMSKEYMESLLEVAKKSGLKCQIGG